MLNVALLTLAGYLSGSVLYSKLIAHYILRVDLSTVGDGNPGMTNIVRAGGVGWAVLAFLADSGKALVPVGIAYYFLGIQGWGILPIALAPGVGHAYPIFFGFKGGKAIAAMGGAWIGIAILEVIVVGATLLVFWSLSVRESAWATILMLISTLVYLLLTKASLVWVGCMMVTILFLAWTHRKDLSNPPGVKPWVERVVMLWH